MGWGLKEEIKGENDTERGRWWSSSVNTVNKLAVTVLPRGKLQGKVSIKG